MSAPSAQFEDITYLETKLNSSNLPKDLFEKARADIERLVRLASSKGYGEEYDAVSRYLDWIVSLPWNVRSQDVLALDNAKKVLDSNHFGLENIKERILEFVSVANLRSAAGQESNSPAILLLGLVGTGKTTMAYSIAQALGRKFGRIPMGGMGDAAQLRGRSRSHTDAEPGQIIKVLRRVQTKNPVILLDEIDRVTDEGRASIMGVLVELLDPKQNHAFVDHYLDYPVDLSSALFIATANNTNKIATAVMDRLEPIQMPSYSDAEKIAIGQRYVLPEKIKMAGLPQDALHIADDIWPLIVRPLGFDAGIRTLERTIDGVVRKVARSIVEGKGTKFVLTPQNVKQFLPQ